LKPERVYLGTADGQIYRSDDWAKSWRKLTPGIGRRELVVDAIAIAPDDPDRIWAGGWELKSDRGGLYTSPDGGDSWQRVDLGIYESSIRAVAVAPSNGDVVAVGITEGVLLSRDRGLTWNRVTRGYRSLYDVHSLVFDPLDSNLLYVGTWRLAWKTPDLGKTWQPIHEGMFWDSDLFSIQVSAHDREFLLAGACSGVYRSSDRGGRWERMKNGIPDAAKRTRVVRVDPTRPGVLYAGTTEGLYRSENGGDSWQCLLPGVVINSVLINVKDSRRILLGTDDAGVLVSSEDGRDFRPGNSGFYGRQVTKVAWRGGAEEALFAAVTLDSVHGGFFWSRDGGRNWQTANEGLGELASGIRDILPSLRDRTVFLGSPRGVLRGVPGERGWHCLPGTELLLVNSIRFADPDESTLLIAAKSGIYSYSLARNRAQKLKVAVYDREVFSVLVEPDSGSAFLGTEMGVFRSDDGGRNWVAKVEGLPYEPVNSLAFVGSRLFAATRTGLFYSDDKGDHWRRTNGVFPIEITSVEAGRNPGDVVAADPLVGYLFASYDLGETWEPINLGLELSRISSLERTSDGRLLAGTVTEGVYEIILQPETLARSGLPSQSHPSN